MKVGVAVPARNARPWVEEMLASVAAQTHPAGVYVAEDWSDDGTHEFLAARADLYTAMTRTRRRLGWPGALNTAAELAFADGCDALFTAAADDLLHPTCVARCVEAMESAGLDFVIPWAQQFGGADAIQASLPDATLDDLAQWPPLIDKGLFRRRLWETVGGYSPEATVSGTYGCAEDWEFWIKVWEAGLTRYTVVETPLYFVRVHPDQLSDTRGEHHAAAAGLFREMHPNLPWDANSGLWPPIHRRTRRAP